MAESILAGVLGVIGVAGYWGTGRRSRTALIPAVFGAFLGFLILVAQLAAAAAPAIAIAVLVVISLGLLATFRGISACVKARLDRRTPPPAAVSKAAMALACGGYLVLHLARG